MENNLFKLHSEFKPAGDQPNAIHELTEGLLENKKDQILLGVTGSGKTFTMANVIQATGRPALIMAHNKTLAAQIYSEMKGFFPENAVEYFVSYYDYYQPEAYIARTDTYIEKDSSINEQIDLMRHSATRSLLERRDVIVVASVSCIYGLGSPELYSEMVIFLKKGAKFKRQEFIERLISLQYERNDIDFSRGHFRVRGDVIDVFPSHFSDKGWRISFFGDQIETITEFDSLTGEKLAQLPQIVIYANSHFVTPENTIKLATEEIKKELKNRLVDLGNAGKILEAARLKQRTEYDLEMLTETGTCKGIENYSRYLSGRAAGKPPPTLFEYLPKDAILFIDESHVSVPQVGAMYNGDRARKTSLVEHGFRLPSALDNRPLKFEEFDYMRPQTIYVSATPSKYELGITEGKFTQQVIRPTGLVDPECIIRPAENQIDDLIGEIKKVIAKKLRILVTTLTKKMAENISEYLRELNIKVSYLHSEILTLERIEIIQDLRKGEIDVLVGVNLLREGLDIPECGLVAILDADKEGFLRSETSLIQTIGRAARNAEGKVILYADVMTNSMRKALGETDRRRTIQQQYNIENNITPKTINKSLTDILTINDVVTEGEDKELKPDLKKIQKTLSNLRRQMLQAAEDLNFEQAASIRDKIQALEQSLMFFAGDNS